MPLTKKVQQIGGSLGIALPKAIMDQHDFHQGTEVEIIDLPEGIFIAPVGRKSPSQNRRQRVAALISETVVTHRKTLEKLAK
jgi:antitoxin component of MazEF toxin-antitoxin module